MKDRLFPGIIGRGNACFNFTSDVHFGYVHGFKRGGDALVAYVEEKGDSIDMLVYPICFNYRHYLEITLKDLVETCFDILEKTGSRKERGILEREHDLSKIWLLLQEQLILLRKVVDMKESIDQFYKDAFPKIDKFIKEFTQIDPGSFTFRYSKDRKGINSIPRNVRSLNIFTLRDELGVVYEYLYSFDLYLSSIVELKEDINEF